MPTSTLSHRRRYLAAALLVAATAIAIVSAADIGNNLVYFWTPTQVYEAEQQAYGANIRLGGVVDSVQSTNDNGLVVFVVSDGENEITVHSKNTPPAMFRVGIGVVVEGTLVQEGFFEATQLMVKHSNEYRAPEDGADPSDLYKTVEGL